MDQPFTIIGLETPCCAPVSHFFVFREKTPVEIRSAPRRDEKREIEPGVVPAGGPEKCGDLREIEGRLVGPEIFIQPDRRRLPGRIQPIGLPAREGLFPG